MKESTLRGQATYEVHMLATKPDNPAQEIYVDVARADHMPLCIRIRQGKEWNRITIKSLQGGMKLADSDFVFPSTEYRDGHRPQITYARLATGAYTDNNQRT